MDNLAIEALERAFRAVGLTVNPNTTPLWVAASTVISQLDRSGWELTKKQGRDHG